MKKPKSDWRPVLPDLFGNILLLGKNMERLMDQALEPYSLTSRQWFVLAVVAKSTSGAPSLQEVARALNTSHQNIKTIATNLERRGFLNLRRDPNDKRVTRLVATEMNESFWADRDDEARSLIARVFRTLGDEEAMTLGGLIQRLVDDCREEREAATSGA